MPRVRFMLENKCPGCGLCWRTNAQGAVYAGGQDNDGPTKQERASHLAHLLMTREKPYTPHVRGL